MAKTSRAKFPRYLRALRKKQGYTQAALATALGVRPNTVANWESGRCYPHLATMRRLCEVLGLFK